MGIPGAARWSARAGVVMAGLMLALAWPGHGTAHAGTQGQDHGRRASLTVTVGWDPERQEVTVACDVDVVLPAGGKALADLRDGTYSPECPVHVTRDGVYPGLAHWTYRAPELTQPDLSRDARLRYGYTYFLARVSGYRELGLDVAPSELPPTYDGTAAPRVWTVRLSAPKWDIESETGPLSAQSPHALTWRMSSGHDAAHAVVGRALHTSLPATERHQRRGEIVAVLVLVTAALARCAALALSRTAPSARARRRRRAAVWAAAAVTCLLIASPAHWTWTTLVPVAGNGSTVGQVVLHGRVASPSEYPAPDELWSPGTVLGLWLWYALPVLGWWATRLLATRRPPSGAVVAASCGGPLLALLLLRGAGLAMTPATLWAVSGYVFAAAAGALAVSFLRPIPAVVARWGVPAAGFGLVLVCLTELSRSPLFRPTGLPANWATHAALVACTWPAAAWLTALVPLAAGKALPRTLLAGVFAAVCLLLWPSTELLYGYRFHLGALLPWPRPIGYQDLPYVTAGTTLAAVAAYLIRTGRGRAAPGGRRTARGAAGAGVCGAALPAWAAATCMGDADLRSLSTWGSGLAVVWAVLAWPLLVPANAAAGAGAGPLRRMTRPAHARLVRRWIAHRLRADAAAELQRTARTAMAEGSLSADDFTDRQRRLDVSAAGPDRAAAAARLKRAALGSAAGVPPTTAGLLAALVAQALALPWAVYKAATGHPFGTDYATPIPLRDAAEVLRFVHWSVYGFVFGYFYTWTRAATPVGKAAVLLVCVLPVELLPTAMVTLDPQYTTEIADPSWSHFLTSAAGVAGQSFVMCMGLGLFWEWGLARAAAVKWSQLRDFRRLGSITVPVGTVLVAAATAFVTTVAGAVAQQQLQPPPPAGSSVSGPAGTGP